MKYSATDLELLNSQDITRVCAAFGLEIGRDDKVLCPSPTHDERTPSHHIYKNTNSSYCHGCGAGGSVIEFVKLQGMDFLAACDWLIKEFNLVVGQAQLPAHKPTKRVPKKKPAPFKGVDQSKSFVGPELMRYAKARGLPLPLLLELGVKQANKYFKATGREQICFQFPYYRDGKAVNAKYKTWYKKDGKIIKTFQQEPGGEKVVWGLDTELKEDYLIWSEGEEERATWMMVGYNQTWSIPEGGIGPKTKNIDRKFDFMETALPKIKEITKHYIAFDDDPTGRFTAKELVRRLGHKNCLKVIFPEGCKDANDIVRVYTKKQVVPKSIQGLTVEQKHDLVRKCFNEATWFPVDGVMSVSDILESHHMIVRGEYGRNKWSFGMTNSLYPQYIGGYRDTVEEALDLLYQPIPGQLTVLTGHQFEGKSIVALNLAVRAAVLHNVRWALFMPEEYPVGVLIDTLVEILAGKPTRIKDKSILLNQTLSEEELDRHRAFILEHFYIINTEDGVASNDRINESIKELVALKGITGVIKDPLNEIDLEHGFSPGTPRHIILEKVIREEKVFLRKYGLHLILVAHPKKPQYSTTKEGRKKLAPTLHDAAGTNDLANKADYGIVVVRNYGQKHTEVRILKAKQQKAGVGKVGFACLSYNPNNSRMEPDRNKSTVSWLDKPPMVWGDKSLTELESNNPEHDVADDDDLPAWFKL